MRIDLVAYQNAQRQAYQQLAAETMEIQKKDANGKLYTETVKNQMHVKPENITAPMVLVQEQQFVNSQNSFLFDFSISGPKADALHNNVQIGQNNIACIFAIQILLGLGDSANNRVYYSYGFTPADDSLYNSTIAMKFEQSTLIDQMNGQMFRDVPEVNESWNVMGAVLIQPLRFLTGKLGTFQGQVNLINAISGLALTPGLWISFRLHTVWGQASATR